MRQNYICFACHSSNTYDLFLLTDGKVKCPNCHAINQVQTSSISTGIGALFGIVIFLVMIEWLWDGFWWILGWIIDIIFYPFILIWKAAVWIYNIISWPFRFVWQSVESGYIWIFNLFGVFREPSWWEILILIALIILAILSIIWGLSKIRTNTPQ